MKNKKTITDLFTELGVNFEGLKVPKKYIKQLQEILEALDSELNMTKERIETIRNYTKNLRKSIINEKVDSELLYIISFYESTYFYEALKDVCDNNIHEIITRYNNLFNLTERGETELIYCLIKSYYSASDVLFPGFFDELRHQENLFIALMCELLSNIREMMEYELEELLNETFCS